MPNKAFKDELIKNRMDICFRFKEKSRYSFKSEVITLVSLCNVL